MRIIHLLESPHFSGAENVVCQIIRMFHENHQIEMIYCSRDGQIRQALEERNIPFIPIVSLTTNEVKRVIIEYKPDIIHAHDMRASFIAAKVCGKIPLISHIHNNNFNSRGVSVKSIAYLFAALKAKHIFWVSDSSFYGYAFHRLLKNKSEVLYNIIDIDALYQKMALDTNIYDYDIVFLGRLTTQKNPIRLMHVFRELADKKPDVKIAVIGSGDLESETRAEAKKISLDRNVSFLGFQNNPYKMLHDAKLMILTSLWEGTPMCVLEALSLGVPVVSTPTDGVRVVVENGKTGFLSDCDETLVQDCLSIIENEDKHNEMAQHALNCARKLMNIETYKQRIQNSYM